MKSNQRPYKDLAVLVLSTLFIFFFIPLYMMGLSPNDYTLINKTALFKTGALFALCFAVVSAILYAVIRYLFKAKKTASTLVYFVFFWVILAGYLFPLVEKSDIAEPLNIPTNHWHLILVFALSSAMAFIVKTRFARFVFIFLGVFLSLALYSGLYNGFKILRSESVDKKSVAQKFNQLSSKNNVIVIGLDGVPGHMVEAVFASNPKLKASFKDFTLYQNAIASAPATVASIMGEMFGNIDLKTIAKTQAGLLEKLDMESLLVNKSEYDTFTYHVYNYFNSSPETRINIGELANISLFGSRQINYSLNFYEYVVIRVGTKQSLAMLYHINRKLRDTFGLGEFETNTFPKIASKFYPMPVEQNELLKSLENHQGSNRWHKEDVTSILDMEHFIKGLTVGSSNKSARFMHFTFTHFPVDFDASCTYRADDKKWFDENQNEKGLINESECGLKTLSDLLTKLKALGIYDNSFIILKSDHGQPASYYDEAPKNLTINGHKRLGFDRYRPFLMVKNYKQQRDTLAVRKEFVLLDDLAYTVCHNTSSEIDCQAFTGVDILSEHLPQNRDFHIYVVEDENASAAIDTQKEVTLTMGDNLLQMMKEKQIL